MTTVSSHCWDASCVRRSTRTLAIGYVTSRVLILKNSWRWVTIQSTHLDQLHVAIVSWTGENIVHYVRKHSRHMLQCLYTAELILGNDLTSVRSVQKDLMLKVICSGTWGHCMMKSLTPIQFKVLLIMCDDVYYFRFKFLFLICHIDRK